MQSSSSKFPAMLARLVVVKIAVEACLVSIFNDEFFIVYVLTCHSTHYRHPRSYLNHSERQEVSTSASQVRCYNISSSLVSVLTFNYSPSMPSGVRHSRSPYPWHSSSWHSSSWHKKHYGFRIHRLRRACCHSTRPHPWARLSWLGFRRVGYFLYLYLCIAFPLYLSTFDLTRHFDFD